MEWTERPLTTDEATEDEARSFVCFRARCSFVWGATTVGLGQTGSQLGGVLHGAEGVQLAFGNGFKERRAGMRFEVLRARK